MDKLQLTRAELAKFLNNDQDLIIRFESLFRVVEQEIPGEIQDIKINSVASEASKNVLIAKLDELIKSLGIEPPVIHSAEETIHVQQVQQSQADDLTPPVIQNRGITGTYHSSGSNRFIIKNGLIVGIT